MAGTTLVLVDCDRFKAINDAHGHLAGDRVLQSVANLLRAVAGPHDIACRFGGDEFCLLVKAARPSDLEHMAQFVINTARGLLELQSSPPQITTLSIGASVATPGLDWDDWYAQADAALYRAKRLGGNRIEWQGDDALASA
jgi:diguanylate cyclase (GGDEF)-like protein